VGLVEADEIFVLYVLQLVVFIVGKLDARGFEGVEDDFLM
jgi:hypothetical protein